MSANDSKNVIWLNLTQRLLSFLLSSQDIEVV